MSLSLLGYQGLCQKIVLGYAEWGGGGGGGGVQHSSVLFFHIIWSVVKTAVITGVY